MKDAKNNFYFDHFLFSGHGYNFLSLKDIMNIQRLHKISYQNITHSYLLWKHVYERYSTKRHLKTKQKQPLTAQKYYKLLYKTIFKHAEKNIQRSIRSVDFQFLFRTIDHTNTFISPRDIVLHLEYTLKYMEYSPEYQEECIQFLRNYKHWCSSFRLFQNPQTYQKCLFFLECLTQPQVQNETLQRLLTKLSLKINKKK